MMAHELLRQAALILAAGWSKGADARDAAGRIVRLHVGANRSTINPEAVATSLVYIRASGGHNYSGLSVGIALRSAAQARLQARSNYLRSR